MQTENLKLQSVIYINLMSECIHASYAVMRANQCGVGTQSPTWTLPDF